LHIFVPKPFADGQNVRAKLDQQAGVAVADVADPNFLTPFFSLMCFIL